jgi:hypothetical protein
MDVWPAKKQKDGGIPGAAGARKNRETPLQLLGQAGDLKVAATKRRRSEAYRSN